MIVLGLISNLLQNLVMTSMKREGCQEINMVIVVTFCEFTTKT